MDFGFVAALLIAILAIVSVFVEIPIVSDYAFWVMTGAFLLVVGMGYDRECGIRGKAATDSDGRRPSIPIESDHPIRSKATLLIG